MQLAGQDARHSGSSTEVGVRAAPPGTGRREGCLDFGKLRQVGLLVRRWLDSSLDPLAGNVEILGQLLHADESATRVHACRAGRAAAMQLARTVSPSSAYVRIMYSISATGFWVG